MMYLPVSHSIPLTIILRPAFCVLQRPFTTTPRQKDLMCFWFRLRKYLWAYEFVSFIILRWATYSILHRNRPWICCSFRLHSRPVLPNFFGFVVNRTWKSTGRVLQSRRLTTHDLRSTRLPISSPCEQVGWGCVWSLRSLAALATRRRFYRFQFAINSECLWGFFQQATYLILCSLQ